LEQRYPLAVVVALPPPVPLEPDAFARIRAGASAVQVYSALIYEGPGLIGRIKRDLAARLRAEGFASMAEATAARR